MGNIKTFENVNIPPEEVERAEALMDNPAAMLRLIDIIFGFEESRLPPS